MVSPAKLAFVILFALTAPLAAQTPDAPPTAPEQAASPPRTMIGTWEFSNADREKVCALTFRNDQASARKLREAEYVEDSATIDPALCPMLKASIGIDVPVSGDDVADLRSIATIVRRKDAETAALLGPLDHIRRVAKAAIDAIDHPPQGTCVLLDNIAFL